jgi:cytochrome c oxidase assembly factor CtaG
VRLSFFPLRAMPWLGVLASSGARAHGGDISAGWGFDPWVWGGLALLLLLRPRRAAYFCGALAALFLALVWPLETLADESFAAHMAQHMLLIGVAAPLLALSRPALRLRAGRRALAALVLRLARPRNAFLLHGAAIWLGHAPRVIEWSLELRWAHALDHFALVATAGLFWWAMLARGREGYGESALWTLATMVHTGLLGALITFAPRVLYSSHGLEDQQLAGLVMWIPGGLCYLAAGLALAAAWLAGRSRTPAHS